MSKLYDYNGIEVKKGDYIFKEGDRADLLYMIHKGKIQISKGSGSIDEEIKILEEGEFVGEMAVIDSETRSANAIALKDCQLISMDKESFDSNIRDNHKFAVSVIQSLSKRLRETDERVTNLAKNDRTQKILIEILEEFIRKGKKDKSGKWNLLKFEQFMSRLKARFSWNTFDLMTALDSLVAQDKVKMKKDHNGVKWVAYKT